ncbi:MAG: acyl-CoA/acyl-ACP dehydrogenase [Myxococcota bacterium]|nr:acyl-CoA/acyl-ACP dehydrogenase [Myxococcota bacterium]
MDFNFAEADREVAELARQILEDKLGNDRLKEIEAREPVFDSETWQALAGSNLLGIAIPEQYGGMDMGFLALCLLCQEVGRTVAPVPVYPSLVLGALPLGRFGTDEQKAAWLPGVASGEIILSAALTELDSSDPLAPSTRAERTSTGYRLFGEKSLVPAGAQAQRILIPASLDGGKVILAWVNPTDPSVKCESQKSSDRQPHAYLALDGVEVQDSDLLVGEEGEDCLRWLVERATAARCAMQLGVSERALDMTSEYGRERVQFDRPIGSFQAFHQRAADAFIMVEALRLAAWEAAWLLASDRRASEAVAVAKYWAAEGGQFTAYACQHLHGGIGIDVDYPLHRFFIWATRIEHELGSAPHQLEKLGREIAEAGLPEF